ncbi:MAG TPA: FIST N-terminal domain-containing protein, partial [Opitutus sp.]|nr:FIST N-terminal domain-containing protein [Opitutus sp.]
MSLDSHHARRPQLNCPRKTEAFFSEALTRLLGWRRMIFPSGPSAPTPAGGRHRAARGVRKSNGLSAKLERAEGKSMHAAKLRAGTGQSTRQDSRDAGIEAARAAVSRLNGERPALVFVFTSPRFDLAELLAGIRSVTGGATVVGATGSGEIVEGRYLGFGEGVGVLALTAGPYRFGVASASHIRGDLEAAGQRLAQASRAAAGASPHAAVMLLVDSMAGDLQQFVQGIYRVTGPRIALVGAGAGDEQKFKRTLVLHDGAIVEEGAAVIWIASEQPLRVVTRHGWQPIGIPMIVTRVAGTEIVELGGRAAADAYEEQ